MADLTNLPDNSDVAKEKTKAIASGKAAGETVDVIEKKPLMKRLKDQFIAMEPKQVRDSVWKDILAPGITRMASDLIDGVKNRFLFGDGSAPVNPQAKPQIIPYNNMSSAAAQVQQKVKTYGFQNILFPTKQDAVNVLAELQQQIASFDEATVSYFYDLSGFDPGPTNYTPYNYGWRNLDGVSVIQKGPNGWMLDLPNIVKL